MEAVRHVAMGLRSPSLASHPREPPRSLKPTTITCSARKWAHRHLGNFQFLTTSTNTSSDLLHSLSSSTTVNLAPHPPHADPPERHLSICLHYYRVLGAEAQALEDDMKRAFEAKVSEPQYGFSQNTLTSRREILQAAFETLVDPKSRRDYTQSLIDDEQNTIITQVPWDKVPGALCVLQEAGEAAVVLQIGESLLRERLPKSFKQDVVLIMALAYLDMSRDVMALNPPDFVRGRELLEMALKLLQEEEVGCLAPDLQAQIDKAIAKTISEKNPAIMTGISEKNISDEVPEPELITDKDKTPEYQENNKTDHIPSAMDRKEPLGSLVLENAAIMTDISGNNISDEVPEGEYITDKIMNAISTTISAGVAVGMTVAFILSFSPVRIGFIRWKEIGSEMASHVIDDGLCVDENLLEQLPRMDARLAEHIVRKWQNIKSQAFGPDHRLEKMLEVLDGQMLQLWMVRAVKLAELGRVYDYSLLYLTVGSVTVSLDGQHALVEVTIKESIRLAEEVCPFIKTYMTSYEISCSMLGWKIDRGAILL